MSSLLPSRVLDREAEHILVIAELGRVLESPAFLRSLVLSRLLTFLVEHELDGQAQYLKETYIGHVLYGQEPTYDPKLDSVVRVNANRLRKRLDEHYLGRTDVELRIELLRGCYVPVYRYPQGTINGEHRPYPNGGTDSHPSSEFTSEEHSPQINVDFKAYVAEFAPSDLVVPPFTVGQTLMKLVAGTSARTWLFAAILLLLAVIDLSLFFSPLRSDAPGKWKAKPFSRLNGEEEFASFSPDAKRVAFAWSNPPVSASTAIYIQGIDSDTPVRVTLGAGEDTRPAWSPDGLKLAYIRLFKDGRKELRILSLAGQKDWKVTELAGGYPWLCEIPRVSWSQDGKDLFTSAVVSAGEGCVIVAVNADFGTIRPVTQPIPGAIGDVEASVSPDGQRIAFLRNTGIMIGDIYTVNPQGTDLKRITRDNRDIIGFCWDSHDGGLVLASRREDGVPKLWHVSTDGRHFNLLSDGTSAPGFPSMSRDGRNIVLTIYRNNTSIWRLSSSGAKRLISDTGVNADPETSPDGSRIAFRSERTGAVELWVSDRNGQNARRLTFFNGPVVNNPSWSPDSRQIAFECRDRGYGGLCLLNSDGTGSVEHLTSWTSNQILPRWSKDGRVIYFSSNHSGRWEIYRLLKGGSEPTSVTHDGAMRVVPSWGGEALLVTMLGSPGDIHCKPLYLRRLPTFPCSPNTSLLQLPAEDALGMWDASPRGVWYVTASGGKSSDVVSYDIVTREHRKLFSMTGQPMQGDRNLSVEPGGHSALLVRQDSQSADLDLLERTDDR